MSLRSRSRSPIGIPVHESGSNSRFNSPNIDTNVLHLYNIPKSWGHDDVKAFVREKNRTISFGTKFVKIISENNRKKGECLVKFSNIGVCKKGFELLNGAQCQGKIIRALPTSESVPEPAKQENNINTYQMKQPLNSNSNALKDVIEKIKLQVESMKPSGNMQTYGLSTIFLDSLGIKPPLLDKIFIANLDPSVTEEKIREVFGHAGQIVSMQFLKKTDKKPTAWAKIEYDHPVEAVQAISMLHDRELYGKKLVVQMDTNPRLFQKLVPDGLSGFGPGLGENGSILKGVRTTVELQLLKNLPKEQGYSQSEQNQNTNQDSMNQQLQVDPMAMMNMQSSIPAMNNIMPINQNAALLGLQSLLNPQMQHGLYQAGNTELATALAALQSQSMAALQGQSMAALQGQSMAALQGQSMAALQGQSMATMQGQSMAASVPIIAQPVMGQSQLSVGQSDWSQGQNMYNSQNQGDDPDDQYGYSKSVKSHDSSSNRFEADNQSESKRKRSEDRGSRNYSDSDMLVFNNLPASVTLQALNSKMREVGEVKFAEITGQGRAIVRFFNPRDAERCINLFDRSKVDGQTIDVRFF